MLIGFAWRGQQTYTAAAMQQTSTPQQSALRLPHQLRTLRLFLPTIQVPPAFFSIALPLPPNITDIVGFAIDLATRDLEFERGPRPPDCGDERPPWLNWGPDYPANLPAYVPPGVGVPLWLDDTRAPLPLQPSAPVSLAGLSVGTILESKGVTQYQVLRPNVARVIPDPAVPSAVVVESIAVGETAVTAQVNILRSELVAIEGSRIKAVVRCLRLGVPAVPAPIEVILPCVPVPRTPENGAEVPNGRADRSGSLVWDFAWIGCGGPSVYQLLVQHAGASAPVIDALMYATEYQDVCPGCYVAEHNRCCWYWRVRANRVGIWGAWSSPSYFSVAPLG